MISHTCAHQIYANTQVPERYSPFWYLCLIYPQADKTIIELRVYLRASKEFALLVYMHYICIINKKGLNLYQQLKTNHYANTSNSSLQLKR